MNRQTFIDTLRRALYGRVSDYELADHIRYYEDYIQQEIMKGRSEQEVLGELGDPRLIAGRFLRLPVWKLRMWNTPLTKTAERIPAIRHQMDR